MGKSKLIGIGLFSFCLLAAAEESFHVVQPGDTLSKIAGIRLGRPIYGHGSLSRLLAINPEIQNPDLLFPGQKIILEGERAPASDALPVSDALAASNITVPSEPAVPSAPKDPPETDQEFSPTSRLSAALGLEYFRIDSKDKSSGDTAVFLSNLSPRLRLNWDLEWSKEWASRLRIDYRSEKILQDTTSTRTLSNASGSRYGFEAGVVRHWDGMNSSLLIGRAQRIFTRSLNASALSIDRVESFVAKVGHDVVAHQVKNVKLGFGFEGTYTFPGRGVGYTTESGVEGESFLFLRHELKGFSLEGQAYYGISRHESTLVEQTGSRAGLLFGVSWGFE